jgi:hypothetical protein
LAFETGFRAGLAALRVEEDATGMFRVMRETARKNWIETGYRT